VPKANEGLPRQRWVLVSREHHAIAAAIRARDEGQAAAAMRHHLENARIRILDEDVRP
jgi:DNA-binding GntR family transcriptional regulator